MKVQLLLLCSVSGLWFPVQHSRCSEQTHKHTQDDHDKHTARTTRHQLVIDESAEEESVFITAVESSSSRTPDVSSRVADVLPVTAAPHVCGSSCRFPAVQENVSIRERRKSSKGQTGKRSNASRILKEPGSGGSADGDPSLPCRDQEIPTFDEWTKIMMEVENEKSQVTPHLSHRIHAAGKKLQQIFTNYASVECGAKILSSNPEAKSTSAILMENMDMYMLNPCNNKIWFTIELCQPIQVKQLDIANFEIFSSNPKDFLVSISDRYPTKKWVKLGTFHARDERTVQSFPLDEHLFAKYIKVELLSHFGSEHFCPLSLIRVFGTSMMEEYEMNSEPSDRQTHVQDDHDYDQSLDLLPVNAKSSKNLIGSAKDALLTMVNNIAANVIGGDPETSAGRAGNFSTEALNMTEAVSRPEALHSSTSAGTVTEVADQLDVIAITETASVTHEAAATRSPSLTGALDAETRPAEDPLDVQQIVTLLPDAEEEADQSKLDDSKADQQDRSVNGDALRSESRLLSLQEYLLQRCSARDVIQKKKLNSRSLSGSAVITSSITAITESPVAHAQIPSVPEALSPPQSATVDLAPSLTSDLQTLDVTCASVTDCLTATQSSVHLTSEKALSVEDVTSTSAVRSRVDATGGEMISVASEQTGLEREASAPTVSVSAVDESQPASVSALVDEPVDKTPAQAVHPSDGFESQNKELLDVDISAPIDPPSSEIYVDLQNSSDAPAHGSNQKESVFMRLNNRIKVLEMNMSLSGRYLEQLSQRYRKQVEEMQKAFNKTIIKLQNTSRMAEEQDQRQTDSIQVLQAQLENVTRLVLSLSVSVSRLQQEVSDRQNYILLCLLLCVLLGLLICVNFRQMCESPAVDSQRSCFSDREPSDDEPVFLRRRASDPPSLSSLQTPAGGSEQTDSLQQWERCPASKKKRHKAKLNRSPETLAASAIPQSSAGPRETEPHLDTRDVMSDGSSEGSSQADETLFCGFATCARLCDALPAPRRGTQSSFQQQRRDSRRPAERLHQPPQRSRPPPGFGPALDSQNH